MGCGCNGSTWVPPTADEIRAADAAARAGLEVVRTHPRAAPYKWPSGANAPAPLGQ